MKPKAINRCRGSLPGILILVAALSSLQACTTTKVVKANSTPAKQSTIATPMHLLIDIGILPLDPNIPASEEEITEKLIIPDVRRAESQFIAYQLKDTLELTGNWGAVRVTPEPSEAVNLTVSGKILVSDGESLKAHVMAVDSIGRTWINGTYEDAASKFSYERPLEDPFQDFYNKIADDLLKYRDRLNEEEVAELRDVSELKYARYLSPEAFGDFLSERGGRTSVRQLPAEGNAMLARVEQIKEREYLFVDTLDDYYANFYREMKPSYDEWRFATYDEAVRQRQLNQQALGRIAGGAALLAGSIYGGSKTGTYAGNTAAVGGVIGGIGLIKSGMERKQEAEIHEEALRELSQSLGAEISPYVLDIEGRTIELTGTADAQYHEWRRILKDIYAEETGLPVE